jgi:hydroxypyruvate reductase
MTADRFIALSLFSAALEGVDPYRSLFTRLRIQKDELEVLTRRGSRRFPLKKFKEIFVLGAGKAARAMACACEDRLKDCLFSGLVIVPYGQGARFSRVRVVEAGHPLPDRSGLVAGKHILSHLQKATAKTLVLFLTSGGSSALYTVPTPPLGLKDKQKTTERLLKAGATIQELNAVRKHLSLVKGGWSARWAHPATVINFVLSDVVGDSLEVIGSGPFAPDPTTFEKAWEIFLRYDLIPRLPQRVIGHVQKGRKGQVAETPKKGDPCFSKVTQTIIGSNRSALEAARKKAEALGFKTYLLSAEMQGEVRALAQFYGGALREVARTADRRKRPLCLLAGGEPTVIVKGKGQGGRNTELTLAVAREIQGLKGIFFASLGTDGTDGPTDAAGAWADGKTWERARKKGLNPERFLEENDSYTFFQTVGGLIKTGPTGTNVMDLHIALIGRNPS